MKKDIIKLIGSYLVLLILISVITDYVFTCKIINSNKESNYYKLYRLVYENNPLELPILGSSTALRGYIPDSIGRDIYNYGITASNFQKVEPQLLVELSKDKSTPIIIDVPPLFFRHKKKPNIRLEDYLPLVYNSEMRLFLSTYGYMKLWYYIPGVRYFGHYFTYLGMWMSVDHQRTNRGHNKGSRYVDKVNTSEKFAQHIEKRLSMDMSIGYDKNMIDRLDKIISEHANRTFVFVVPPVHKSCYEAGTDLNDFKQLFQKPQLQHNNVEWLIFDGSLYDDTLFLDTSHLNFKGAIRFSKELRKELLKKKII